MDPPARIGRYEVELLLGEGGNGRVLLARDPVLRRQVAVKVLRDDLGLTLEERRDLSERMRQEVCAASTLSHPAMVALHDMGDDERAGLYLVSELIRGPTLRERLHEGALPPAEVAQIARVLGSALTHAHGAGLVHRGVKPENIMLAPTGPKLTDFGISQGDARTPAYSAPEVLASGSFGAGADEFSLAATMYEALTGRRAFPGDDRAAVAAKVSAGKHTAPRSALPALRGFLRLDTVFTRALAKEPKKRFASCEAFGLALATELEGPRVTFLATPAGPRSSATRATRRWQNGIALIAVAVIFTLLLIGHFRQPGAADGASLKGLVSTYAPGEAPRPVHSSASASPASATGLGSAAPPLLSSSAPRVDP
jgi:serine/threonine protein kinase